MHDPKSFEAYKKSFRILQKKVALCLKEEQGGILIYCGIRNETLAFYQK